MKAPIILKLIFTYLTKVKALVFSATLLAVGQNYANAGQEAPILTPAAQIQLSRDLVQTESQDFLRQGQSQIEREVQILRQRQFSSTEPLLEFDQVTPADKSQPSDIDLPQ